MQWSNGLVVHLNGAEPGAETTSVEATIARHAGAGAGVWRISTDFDKAGFMWTGVTPDAVVARRLRTLAKAAWAYLHSIETDSFDVKVSICDNMKRNV